jgi:radical SAM protein with 4Fe4S-binding SPASM domain
MAETVKDCRHPWQWILVSANGEVRPCCFAPRPIGNIGEASFEELWNGATMQQLRRDVLADRVGEICRDAPCKYVQNMGSRP